MAKYAKRGAQKTCSICDRPYLAKGYCRTHYARFKKHGNPLVTKRAPNGSGYAQHGGYVMIHRTNRDISVHRELCEKALGRALRHPEEVHHFNQDKADNGPRNLVVCPDRAYHKLLHRRTAALDGCGHTDWRKCQYCQTWSATSNLVFDKHGHTFHRVCRNQYTRLSYAKRAAMVVAV